MNRFDKFFDIFSRKKCVQTDDGVFELRKTEHNDNMPYPEYEFVFIEKESGKETVIDCRVRAIAPLGVTGVACSMLLPQGDRKIKVAFYEDSEIVYNDAYITDDCNLCYIHNGELMCTRSVYEHEVAIPKDKLVKLGYDGTIHYYDRYFYLNSKKKELVKRNYFDYSGCPIYSVKQNKIASEIMLDVESLVTKNSSRTIENFKTNKKLSDLTWDAKSAEVGDVFAVIRIAKFQNNLDCKNTKMVLSVIRCLKKIKKEQFFCRFVEYILTVCELHWRKEKLFSADNNAYFEMRNRLLQKMDVIIKELIKRDDFSYLLGDFDAFETVIIDMLKDNII